MTTTRESIDRVTSELEPIVDEIEKLNKRRAELVERAGPLRLFLQEQRQILYREAMDSLPPIKVLNRCRDCIEHVESTYAEKAGQITRSA